MKYLAIVQVRMGSTRLPGKSLMKLEGIPVLEHVLARVAGCRAVSRVMVATTVNKEDSAIEELCAKLSVPVFRGSQDDVLDRYYQAASRFNPENVIRITADCPLIDPQIIGNVVLSHQESGADYTVNNMPPTFPDGQDVEVFKFQALEKAWKEARLSSEREHVTPYIRKNPVLFKLNNVASPADLSAKRWTLDHADDYEFISRVYAALYPENPFFGMDDILKLLAASQELEKINTRHTRNEGYMKSLREDRNVR